MKTLIIPEAQQLVRIGTVLQILPVSQSAWYRMITEGYAPKPIRLGPRSVAWRLDDILSLARGEWHPSEQRAAA
ncbi:helix-turn-helix transcriptional regulator [Comamonas flocculans]|uniref:AlpA family phage regulatory protein n=1 Tax=Comamonas flocculans TaxID=2597701 RepID=A0A5B8RVM5_9BURK|nr:AlpA family phage regulatory protein [Comamonas flocculans]QEA13540.1 AlpA family phage regulatory protein [Comamonas flocculans]